jgi:hypothetical protein
VNKKNGRMGEEKIFIFLESYNNLGGLIQRKILILNSLIIMAIIFTIHPASASSNGAHGVEVTNDYLHIDSAYCSCSLSDGYYRHYNMTFMNKCPYCGGKLYYEQAGYWVEGIIVCSRCDMDFCCVHGKEHGRKGYYLYPYDFQASYNSRGEFEASEPTKIISTKVLGKVQKISIKKDHAHALGFP